MKLIRKSSRDFCWMSVMQKQSKREGMFLAGVSCKLKSFPRV